MFFGFLMVLGLIVLEIPFSAWLQIMAVIVGTVSVGLLTAERAREVYGVSL